MRLGEPITLRGSQKLRLYNNKTGLQDSPIPVVAKHSSEELLQL